MSVNRTEIEAWIANDPDEKDAATVKSWLDSNNIDELEKSFNGFLEFGTAGLRGPIRPGPSGMNRAVVARAASGIALYMKSRNLKSVVIGRDARHGSEEFTKESAEIFSAYGFDVYILPRPLPTPVLAFAVNELKMDVGIMVTASHNPPQDNGYKVYLGGTVDNIAYNGSQIISPTDQDIASYIATISKIEKHGTSWTVLNDDIFNEYIKRNSMVFTSNTDLKVVYTAMHGVGTQTLLRLFKSAKVANPILVEKQCDPDPDFPTVAFPNPEEPGAMDLALAKAKEIDADLIIANDPDADRAAAAIKEASGNWRVMRGDEIGILIGHFMAEQKPYDLTGKAFANSIVSSSGLNKIANKNNIEFKETLTGFKYLAKIENLAFGYEEALGYAVDPKSVNDKDGISACLMLVRILSWLKSEGSTFHQYLDHIWKDIGYHATKQLSIRVTNISKIDEVLTKLRKNPPTNFGQYQVTQFDDLNIASKDLPATNGLRFYCQSGQDSRAIRVIIRPSGTEPKMKIYLEVSGNASTNKSLDAEKVEKNSIIESLSIVLLSMAEI